MAFFTDESGHFGPKRQGDEKYGGIVCVVLNDQVLSELEGLYGGIDKKELKKKLRSEYSKEILAFLAKNNCTVFAVMYNANWLDDTVVKKHKVEWINSLLESCKKHPRELVESVKFYADKLEELKKGPEYIKALLMIKLLENVLRGVVCQSGTYIKDNLKDFKFVCDDDTVAVMPIIKNLVYYSMFCNASQFPLDVDDKKNIEHMLDSSGKYFDARFFYNNIQFVSDEDSLGVVIADVVINQLYRTWNEKIVPDPELWRGLLNNPHSLEIMHFDIDKEFIDVELPPDLAFFADIAR